MVKKRQRNPSESKQTIVEHFVPVTVEKGALWGEQTQRSLKNFNIGQQCFEVGFIEALVNIKRASADVNYEAGILTSDRCRAIVTACDEILSGRHPDQFPLRIWQTGSGTQTNMNINEVVCSLANRYLAEQNNDSHNRVEVHPNDHVNMSQSSNDVFPTAMHLVVARQTHEKLFIALTMLSEQLSGKQGEFEGIYTVGRTHLMDALPLTVGSVLSGYVSQLEEARKSILESLNGIYALAVGGTAVGSGKNAPAGFGANVAARLAEQYDLPFIPHDNLYAAVSGEDASLRFSAALKQLAAVLLKLSNDFRLLGSGPRCGLNEWQLPANEPGSSIMPGKVNPTQCEALSMVCLQVFGNDLTVSMAASQGQLQLNTYRPVIIHNLMESIELLADSMTSFTQNCVAGLAINRTQVDLNMTNNLSTITLLAPMLGYDVATNIVHEAHAKDIPLAEAAQSLGVYTKAEFASLLKSALAKAAGTGSDA